MENKLQLNPGPLAPKEYQVPLWLQEVLKELRSQFKNRRLSN
jgi:hypothetical protein